jgi:hypothetical protein
MRWWWPIRRRRRREVWADLVGPATRYPHQAGSWLSAEAARRAMEEPTATHRTVRIPPWV